MNMQWLKALSEWNKFRIDSSAVIKKIMIDDAAHEKSAERGEKRRDMLRSAFFSFAGSRRIIT